MSDDSYGFRQDARRAVRYMKKALTRSQKLSVDPEFMLAARRIVAANNQTVFASKGQAISAGWGERDYVETGALRASMTTPGAMPATVTKTSIVFRGRPRYQKRHRFKIYGWVFRNVVAIATEVDRILLETVAVPR